MMDDYRWTSVLVPDNDQELVSVYSYCVDDKAAIIIHSYNSGNRYCTGKAGCAMQLCCDEVKEIYLDRCCVDH